VLLNQCPHQIDLFQWFFGMPTRIRAFCRLGRYHDIEVEDDVTAYMEFANGSTATFIMSTGEYPGTNRLEIAADRGKLVFEDDQISFTRTEVPVSEFIRTSQFGFNAPEVWNVAIPAEKEPNQQLQVLRRWVSAIREDTPLVAPATDGIKSVELANAILLSALEERTIDLPLDSAAYERKLQELIAGSTRAKKKTDEMRKPVADPSFRY
jgi:predicted dehydrogenase